MLGVVFPRSLQVPWVGKDFLNLLMMRGITRFSWCFYTLLSQDMPTRLEELLTILILIRQRMQERQLLGAEAGVPVSGGKREGTQYDL